ncbi:MAG: hypothetical protein JXB04_01210 [Kiritimatiellae bacterium]|nr:hypothetical protein [Kiritimatiellia bacterium]
MKKLGMSMAGVLVMTVAAQAMNLVLNPGFESEPGPGDWSVVWGSFSREDWNRPPEGDYAGYIRGNWGGDTESGGAIQRVQVEPGKVYVLRARFYTDNGWAATSRAMKLEFFDGDGALIETYSDDLSVLREGRWMEKSITGWAPEGTALAQIVFEANGLGDKGVLGIDDVVLEAEAAR